MWTLNVIAGEARNNPENHEEELDCFVAEPPRNDGEMTFPEHRMKRHASWIATPLLLVAIVLVWDGYVSLFKVSPLILPAPAKVWNSLLVMLQERKTLWHIWTTLFETVAGFVIAVIVGIVLGGLLGKIRWLEQTLNPLIVGLQVMPKVALIPLFIVWFGFGMTSKVVLAAVIAFFPIMTNTILGIKSVETGHSDVMLALNASRWNTFREVEAAERAAVHSHRHGGRHRAGDDRRHRRRVSRRQPGLGYMAVATLNAFDVTGMFAVILLLTVLGLVLYFFVVLLRRYVTPWHQSVATDKNPR